LQHNRQCCFAVPTNRRYEIGHFGQKTRDHVERQSSNSFYMCFSSGDKLVETGHPEGQLAGNESPIFAQPASIMRRISRGRPLAIAAQKSSGRCKICMYYSKYDIIWVFLERLYLVVIGYSAKHSPCGACIELGRVLWSPLFLIAFFPQQMPHATE